jgi:chromosome segregation ATPase
VISIQEITFCLSEDQYNLLQTHLNQFRQNKKSFNFLLERISSTKQSKEARKKRLDSLNQRRASVQEQINSNTKELEQLREKKKRLERNGVRTEKVRKRMSHLIGANGRLYTQLSRNLTKAFEYRIIKSINCKLMDYIHRYKKKIIENQRISKDLKDIIANNVNWCELIE